MNIVLAASEAEISSGTQQYRAEETAALQIIQEEFRLSNCGDYDFLLRDLGVFDRPTNSLRILQHHVRTVMMIRERLKEEFDQLHRMLAQRREEEEGDEELEHYDWYGTQAPTDFELSGFQGHDRFLSIIEKHLDRAVKLKELRLKEISPVIHFLQIFLKAVKNCIVNPAA